MTSGINDPIKLKAGRSTTIKLKGLATAGYEWNCRIEGEKNCIEVSKEFVLPGKISKKNVGESADEVFTISAQKKGTANVHFSQKRNWEKNVDPVNEKEVTIVVE